MATGREGVADQQTLPHCGHQQKWRSLPQLNPVSTEHRVPAGQGRLRTAAEGGRGWGHLHCRSVQGSSLLQVSSGVISIAGQFRGHLYCRSVPGSSLLQVSSGVMISRCVYYNCAVDNFNTPTCFCFTFSKVVILYFAFVKNTTWCESWVLTVTCSSVGRTSWVRRANGAAEWYPGTIGRLGQFCPRLSKCAFTLCPTKTAEQR